MVDFNKLKLSCKQAGCASPLRLLLAVVCISLTPIVNAADVEKRILVTSGVEYDSNPQMSEINKDPVWVYRLFPQLKLDILDDLNRWYVDAGLEILRHSNEKAVVNQDNPKLTGGWNRSYESGMFGINAGYQEASARNAELNNTGLFTNLKNVQTTKSLGANWQHRIASRWSVLTEVAHSDFEFSEAGLLEDYKLSGLKSKLSYENSDKLTTYALLGYSVYDPDVNKTSYLARAGIGADYQLSEQLTILSRASLYKLSGRQSDSDWEAGLKAEYTTGKSLYSASLARNVEDSGLGFRVVDSARLGGQYSFTERDRIGADYSFDQYKKDSSLFLDKLDTQTLGLFYVRDISEHWFARVYANHRELDFSGSNPKGNSIGVTLVFDTLNF